MFGDTVLNIYTTNQIEVPTLPSKESKEIFHFVYCQIIRGVVILTENSAFLALSCRLPILVMAPRKWKHLFFFSALLATHSGVGSTFQVLVFGWNSKLLVCLEVRII